jgi:hypothetical protein
MRLALPRKNMKVELVEGLLQETYMIAIRQAGFNRAYAYSGLGISSNTWSQVKTVTSTQGIKTS